MQAFNNHQQPPSSRRNHHQLAGRSKATDSLPGVAVWTITILPQLLQGLPGEGMKEAMKRKNKLERNEVKKGKNKVEIE